MGLMIYESGADHRATAERHFRNAEKQMLENFKGLEKGYESKVKGWSLTLESESETQKINLMETCKWKVSYFEDFEMAVIGFEMGGKPHELMFSKPVLFDSRKVEFIGMRRL